MDCPYVLIFSDNGLPHSVTELKRESLPVLCLHFLKCHISEPNTTMNTATCTPTMVNNSKYGLTGEATVSCSKMRIKWQKKIIDLMILLALHMVVFVISIHIQTV